jgi:hypothetical protein
VNEQRVLGLIFAASIVLSLLGCGGGGLSSLPANGSAASSATGATTLSLSLPGSVAGSSDARSSQAVPSGINGVNVFAYASSGTQPSTPTLVGDLSLTPTSGNKSLCVAVSGGRSCTIAFTSPLGADTIVVQLYDAEPVSGTIPGTANLVASGMTSVTVSTNGNNVANIVLNSTAGTVDGSGGATFAPLTASANAGGITGGSVVFAIPAGGVPSGEQVAVSEVVQLNIPLSGVRRPQVVTTATPLPTFGPSQPGASNTFVYAFGFTISGGTKPLALPLTVGATFQITPALATTLGTAGTLLVAQQSGTSYTVVGSLTYVVTSGTTLAVAGTATGILQPGIYVLYFPPPPTPAPTKPPPPP